jgi:hypothetical protein
MIMGAETPIDIYYLYVAFTMNVEDTNVRVGSLQINSPYT